MDHGNQVSDTALGTARNVGTAIIGAGMSGLVMGIRLKNAGRPFRILEKAQSVGGTWRENTYPGLSCDVPSFFILPELRAESRLVPSFLAGVGDLRVLRGCGPEVQAP